MDQTIAELDPAEVVDRLDEVHLVDVREPAEWQAGRIEGSQHVPMQQVPGRIGELSSEGPVVAVCRTGARSAQVTAYLSGFGVEAYNLRGGLKAWHEAGLPLSTPDGQPGSVA